MSQQRAQPAYDLADPWVRAALAARRDGLRALTHYDVAAAARRAGQKRLSRHHMRAGDRFARRVLGPPTQELSP